MEAGWCRDGARHKELDESVFIVLNGALKVILLKTSNIYLSNGSIQSLFLSPMATSTLGSLRK
jgi:hypothetical protein